MKFIDSHLVLELGTGNGQLTLYPNAEVIGTDLNVTEHERAPENCKFVISDAEEPWDFPHKFDFVHLRDLMMCFRDQKAVFKAAFDALEPGGYCQILDLEFPLSAIDDSADSSGIAQWFRLCVKEGEAVGRPWTNIQKYRHWLADIGFEDVTETVFYNPINDWAIGAKEKKIGLMMQKNMKRFFTSSKGLLTEGLKWNEEDVNKLAKEAEESGRNRNIHAYLPM